MIPFDDFINDYTGDLRFGSNDGKEFSCSYGDTIFRYTYYNKKFVIELGRKYPDKSYEHILVIDPGMNWVVHKFHNKNHHHVVNYYKRVASGENENFPLEKYNKIMKILEDLLIDQYLIAFRNNHGTI